MVMLSCFPFGNVVLLSLQEGIIDDDDLLSFLLGGDFSAQSTAAPSPGSASSSSDSAYLTSSPGVGDLDLDMDVNSDMLGSSAPASQGEISCGNNFDIDFGEYDPQSWKCISVKTSLRINMYFISVGNCDQGFAK